MSETSRIHKKLDDNHVVWFRESNQWVGFLPPAFKVYKWNEQGKSRSKIHSKLVKRYGLSNEIADSFIEEILEGIEQVTANTISSQRKKPKNISNIERDPHPFSVRQYLINGKCFRISFGSKLIEYYIHPPLAHLENSVSGKADEKFHLRGENASFTLVILNDRKAWITDSVVDLKRKLSLTILNSIYNASYPEWFSRIHASAITNGKDSILLSSESGSGKSTLAALLQSKGLRVVSDDFVAMRNDKLAYPVPSGISIKRGAYPVIRNYFPDFEPENEDRYAYGNKDVCFMSPLGNSDMYAPVTVKAMVFIAFRQDSEFKLNEIAVFDALGLYHQEAWVDNSYDNALLFIEWFEQLSFYKLEYSNTEKALNAIQDLFDYSQNTEGR